MAVQAQRKSKSPTPSLSTLQYLALILEGLDAPKIAVNGEGRRGAAGVGRKRGPGPRGPRTGAPPCRPSSPEQGSIWQGGGGKGEGCPLWRGHRNQTPPPLQKFTATHLKGGKYGPKFRTSFCQQSLSPDYFTSAPRVRIRVHSNVFIFCFFNFIQYFYFCRFPGAHGTLVPNEDDSPVILRHAGHTVMEPLKLCQRGTGLTVTLWGPQAPGHLRRGHSFHPRFVHPSPSGPRNPPPHR